MPRNSNQNGLASKHERIGQIEETLPSGTSLSACRPSAVVKFRGQASTTAFGRGNAHQLAVGLYHYPRQASFGPVPAEHKALVTAFLKDHGFLLMSPNAYNSPGAGLAQLYNTTWVYDHKRHGRFQLGKRNLDFRVKAHFPKTLSEEFLIVDLVDSIHCLAEDREATFEKLKKKKKNA